MSDLRSNWSIDTAIRLAKEEGIELTKEHWRLIGALRANFEEDNVCPTALKATKFLMDNGSGHKDKKELYTMFPGGPVLQAYKIAGLPIPSGAKDLSFGSVM